MNDNNTEPAQKITLADRATKYVPLILPSMLLVMVLFFVVDFILERYYLLKYDRVLNLSDMEDYVKFCMTFVSVLFVKKTATKLFKK